MAKSKPYQETISLGKKIIEEFSSEESYDTTLRWMAHYIAELIQAAEKETNVAKKRKLQEECAAVILILWQKRAYFRGNTRPLANFADVIPILQALRDEPSTVLSWQRFAHYEDGSPWGAFMGHVRHSMDTVLKISLCAAVSEQSLRKEKEWLKYQSLLSEDESKIIKYLDQLLLEGDLRHRVVFVEEGQTQKEKTPPEKLVQVFDKLEALISTQVEYLTELREKIVKRPTTKKIKRKRN